MKVLNDGSINFYINKKTMFGLAFVSVFFVTAGGFALQAPEASKLVGWAIIVLFTGIFLLAVKLLFSSKPLVVITPETVTFLKMSPVHLADITGVEAGSKRVLSRNINYIELKIKNIDKYEITSTQRSNQAIGLPLFFIPTDSLSSSDRKLLLEELNKHINRQ